MQSYQVRICRPTRIEPRQHSPLRRAQPIAVTFEYFKSQTFKFVVAGRSGLRGNCHTRHVLLILDL